MKHYVVDPSGLPQVGPSGPNNNYQMAPRAHSNTVRSWPFGPIQKLAHRAQTNLFSPSGSYAGPSGPYESWPSWPRQNMFSPSGLHVGPSGPQHIPYIPNTYLNEAQRDLPVQLELPHRRRRGANKNNMKKNRQGDPKSKSKSKANLILESRITVCNKERYEQHNQNPNRRPTGEEGAPRKSQAFLGNSPRRGRAPRHRQGRPSRRGGGTQQKGHRSALRT